MAQPAFAAPEAPCADNARLAEVKQEVIELTSSSDEETSKGRVHAGTHTQDTGSQVTPDASLQGYLILESLSVTGLSSNADC